MPENWTKTKSFAHFGASTTNQRWSWSARSDDGKVVVMTLWKDLLEYSADSISYNTFDSDVVHEWENQLGIRERIENLKWARDKCDGQFRVIITVAEDPAATPRKIAKCFPHDRLIMKISELNEETGEFIAVNIGK